VKDNIILYNSDEAAHFRNDISGWVSSGGRFYGNDEDLARWAGCTHKKCSSCGNIISKQYSICADCKDKKEASIFNSFPKIEWDGKVPISIFQSDTYFFSEEDLDNYCWEHDCEPYDLQLVLCKPVHANEIDSDYYADSLAEDTILEEVAPELAEKIEQLNSFIRENKFILSWEPSHIQVVVN